MCTSIIFLLNRAAKKLAAITLGCLMAGVVVVTLGLTSPAQAQDSGQSADDVIDEIVTTARRREEALHEVPLAISVMSGDDLERIGAADIIIVG